MLKGAPSSGMCCTFAAALQSASEHYPIHATWAAAHPGSLTHRDSLKAEAGWSGLPHFLEDLKTC